MNWIDVTFDQVMRLSLRAGTVFVGDIMEALECKVVEAVEALRSLGVFVARRDRILRVLTVNGMLELESDDDGDGDSSSGSCASSQGTGEDGDLDVFSGSDDGGEGELF